MYKTFIYIDSVITSRPIPDNKYTTVLTFMKPPSVTE